MLIIQNHIIMLVLFKLITNLFIYLFDYLFNLTTVYVFNFQSSYQKQIIKMICTLEYI